MLTSSECVKDTEEKERKKKEKLIEKDAKKKLREAKKQQKPLQNCPSKSSRGENY